MAAPDLAAPSVYAESAASPRTERRADFRGLFKAVNTAAEVSADFVASALGFIAAHVAASSLSTGAHPHSSLRTTTAISAILGLLTVILMHREGGYRGGSGLLRIRDTERSIRISTQSLTLVCAIELLMGQSLSGPTLLIAIVLIPSLLILEQQLWFTIALRAQQNRNGAGCAVVYGAGTKGRRVASTLIDSPRLGLRPTTMVDDSTNQFACSILAFGYRNRRSIPVRPGPITPGMLRSLQCDMLLITTDDDGERDIAVRAGHEAGCAVALITGPRPQMYGEETIDIDGLLFTSAARPSAPWHYSIAKRITDVVLSSLLLLVLAPLLLLIAFLVRLDSPGRALFVQKRVGKNGRLFRMLKFRTMYCGAPEYSPSPLSSSDPRITRIGRLLRQINLDELPQLLNVLEGSMSLVGPRPEMPFIVERYNALHRRRLEVIPGITGLWQLSADRSFPIHENIEYDFYYTCNRGFFLDLAILAHTLMFAMTGGI